MITCLSRFLTVLVAMVLCLSTWSGYVLGHSNVGSVRYNSKHLKGTRGDMVIHTDIPGQNEELTLIEETEVLLQEDDDHHEPVHFQAIPVDYFRTVIGQTASYHEVLRIFLGKPYTDSEIDHLMARQGHHHQGDRTSTGISGQGMTLGSQSEQTALVQYYDITRGRSRGHRSHHTNHETQLPIFCDFCFNLQSEKLAQDSSPREMLFKFKEHNIKRARKRRHNNDMYRRTENRKKKKIIKKCKTRRQKLANDIKQCKRRQNRRRCAKLRERYKKLRQRCKKTDLNESIIPTTGVGLPDPRPPTTTTTTTTTEEPEMLQEQDYPQDWLRWEATQGETLQKAQCSTPVPEVIRVRDLTLEAGVEYMPHCVLVYRCKNDTGCCSSGYQCASKSSVNVTKYILVGVPSSQGGSGMIEMDRIQQIALQNDTECHCIKIPPISIKPCPYPFNYSLHDCKCVSPAHERHCKKISKGVNRLHTPDRICVQHGDCRPLDTSVCPYGYSIELGKCESFDGSADDRTPHRSSRT